MMQTTTFTTPTAANDPMGRCSCLKETVALTSAMQSSCCPAPYDMNGHHDSRSENESDNENGSDDSSSFSQSYSSYADSDTSGCCTLLDQMFDDQGMLLQWKPPPAEPSTTHNDGEVTHAHAQSSDNGRASPALVAILNGLCDKADKADKTATTNQTVSTANDDSCCYSKSSSSSSSELEVEMDLEELLKLRVVSRSSSARTLQSYLQTPTGSVSIGPHCLGFDNKSSHHQRQWAKQAPSSLTPSPPLDKNHPQAQLKQILQDIIPNMEDLSSHHLLWNDYFIPVTFARTQAYTREVTTAMRSQNLDMLRGLLEKTLPQQNQSSIMNACNEQGESLQHLACRRPNAIELLEFLVNDAKVTLNVRDDCGKTALHDMCWASLDRIVQGMPRYFDAVKFIVQQCPALLFCQDERGFTPLFYIPQDAWPVWTTFLLDNHRFLRLQVQRVRIHVEALEFQDRLQSFQLPIAEKKDQADKDCA